MLDGPPSRLDIEKEYISELEDTAIETIQLKQKKKHN